VQVRHVADADRLVGEQAAGKDRQHGVLGAGNGDLAVEWHAAVDEDFGHKSGNRRSGIGNREKQRGARVKAFAILYSLFPASSGVNVFSASAWIAPPISSPSVA